MCRRSLRLWPISGSDLKAGLGDFLKLRLRISPVFLSDMGEIGVKRVASTSTKFPDEVIALFSTVEVRDTVRRAAKELAGDTGAGVRLEIPFALQPSLKALESVSYNLKQKNKEVKRSIKFDDHAMDLVLDFNIDPSAPGSQWKRVTAVQAKQMRSKLATTGGRASEVTDNELSSMLDLS